MNFVDFVVRGADGSVDTALTLERVATSLESWVDATNAAEAEVVSMLDGLFDGQEAGKRVALQSLVLMALQKTGKDITNPKEMSAMKTRIASVVEAHPRFDTSVGRNGGVRRVTLPSGASALVAAAPVAPAASDTPAADTASDDDVSASDAEEQDTLGDAEGSLEDELNAVLGEDEEAAE